MPEMVVNIPIKDIAHMINNMSKQEVETLRLFLTEEGTDLLKRNNDLQNQRVKYLTEEEAFGV
ncbi:hypothetical protein TI05_10755 [Achromatium sp. WMS3]|nr:hypothetical protein TI05_10755 [Achromatium sp. WMS3]